MFTAFSSNHQWYNLFELPSHHIKALPAKGYFCPDCGHAMILKKGKAKLPHFAHVSTCNTTKLSPLETESHIKGKHLIYHAVRTAFPICHIEYFIPSIIQRADIFLELPHHLALEFQCSAVSHEEIKSRTNGYNSLSFDVRWIIQSKHLPHITTRYQIIKLTRFLEACIYVHKNGVNTLLFLDEETQEVTFIILHLSLNHREYIVEKIVFPRFEGGHILIQPKADQPTENDITVLLAKNQRKQKQEIFRYRFNKTELFYYLATKWNVNERTFPQYIGLACFYEHTLGKDIEWQFKVVNFLLTVREVKNCIPSELTDLFLESLPNQFIHTPQNHRIICMYIEFLQSFRLPKKIVANRQDFTNYIILWYRFQSLAKPSKD